jgi:hypothetical protein
MFEYWKDKVTLSKGTKSIEAAVLKKILIYFFP